MTILDFVLLILMAGFAVWTAVRKSLLQCAFGLAVVSILLTIMMFRFDAPLSAVFELSVCAGLITVIFVYAISLTRIQTQVEEHLVEKERKFRYGALPFIIVIAGLFIYFIQAHVGFIAHPPSAVNDVREVLWNHRLFDIVGLLLVIMAGVFGVVVLFKEKDTNE
jgi:NADH-quinone oxidoreductase subunit J